MNYNPQIHHRRSIRLKGYDYSQSGMYYITMVLQHRLHLFGKIINGKMELNNAGKMVESVWKEIPKYYPGIDVDEYVIMPNHFHGIVVIDDGVGNCPNIGMGGSRPITGTTTGGRPYDESIVGDGPRAIPKRDAIPNAGDGPRAIPKRDAIPNAGDGPRAIPKRDAIPNAGDGPRAIPKRDGHPQGDAPTGDDATDATDDNAMNLSLSDVVGRFKSMVMTNYIKGVKENKWKPFHKKLWQRNYYEHIVRNDKDYERIVEYIRMNPENWGKDKNNIKSKVVIEDS